jgi:hypothetical protein
VSDLWVVGDPRTLLFAGRQGLANSTFSHVGGLPDLFMEHDAMAEAPRGRPPRNPEVNMTGESDGASPHNAESGPAPPQAPAAEPSARKRARRDRPMPPPPSSQEQMALVPALQASENSSSQEQMALVPTSQASENVCIHPRSIAYCTCVFGLIKLRFRRLIVLISDDVLCCSSSGEEG